MEVETALLCKNVTEDPKTGATDILGVFDVLHFDRFPAHLDSLTIAIKFRGTDGGRWGITLEGPSGAVLYDIGQFPKRPGTVLYAITSRFDPVLLRGLEFKQAGSYSVSVGVEGSNRVTIPLEVRETPPWARPGEVIKFP